ncbi:DUF4857 domain-containing protein [Odoribacter sp. OttesenSCG-928-J03]|nr:DUF4857 domain-containing protein [Odoribacter sp. OttesenSCG-928-J03]MDL2283333.1 DUF4857 domain-containing protein [Odoribacter sp. OttesenSCG-928-G04]MDL2331050.1 DUF4857 domain-containing protein [Odoribacter sp. OttesenSCG-928-A06]
MLRFNKIFFYATIVILLLWQLPWCYNFFTSRPVKKPFVLYSSVLHDFILTGNEDGSGLKRRDLSDREYTQYELDSLLPTFYYRQLITDGRLPDSLNGVAITPRAIQQDNFTFRITPSDINAPKIELYPLLESMSGRVDLEMPDDVFRITHKGIHFIDMNTNVINEEKSTLFTEAMLKKGFQFPAQMITGNPTTRKEYDEGYLILDSGNHLFHLKRVQNRPYVRAIEIPADIQLKHLFVTEFRNRKTLGFATDINNAFYVLEAKTYHLQQVPIRAYNPNTDAFVVFGNMFDWTVRVLGAEVDEYYAIDANDYSMIKKYEPEAPVRTLAEKIGKYIFPVRIHFTSPNDKYVKPRV